MVEEVQNLAPGAFLRKLDVAPDPRHGAQLDGSPEPFDYFLSFVFGGFLELRKRHLQEVGQTSVFVDELQVRLLAEEGGL